jgi:hypothetical protein
MKYIKILEDFLEDLNSNSNVDFQRQTIIDKIKKIYESNGFSKNTFDKAKQVDLQLKNLYDQLSKIDKNIIKTKNDSDCNKLTSLEGCPKIIDKFFISSNTLTSLTSCSVDPNYENIDNK